jgi:hypothetical protein
MLQPTQSDLETRLRKIAEMLPTENSILGVPLFNRAYGRTGFVPVNPEKIIPPLVTIAQTTDVSKHISIDLGCGVGSWTLMAAAAGIPSYGIDMNFELIREARKNLQYATRKKLIPEGTPCTFAEGNIYPEDLIAQYEQSSSISRMKQMPTTTRINPYSKLGMTISQATIIYAYLWSENIHFLFKNFLNTRGNPDALYVLPMYGYRVKHADFSIERVNGSEILWRKKN